MTPIKSLSNLFFALLNIIFNGQFYFKILCKIYRYIKKSYINPENYVYLYSENIFVYMKTYTMHTQCKLCRIIALLLQVILQVFFNVIIFNAIFYLQQYWFLFKHFLRLHVGSHVMFPIFKGNFLTFDVCCEARSTNTHHVWLQILFIVNNVIKVINKHIFVFLLNFSLVSLFNYEMTLMDKREMDRNVVHQCELQRIL